MAKVYVSSTVADLEAERQAVMDWLVAAGHQPVHSYRPSSETVRESCLDDVQRSDLFVVIIGHRYGFQPLDQNPDGLSITHLEFRQAQKKPRIALIRQSIPDVRLSDISDCEKLKRIEAFREEVQQEVRYSEFRDAHGLIQALSTGIQDALDKLSSSGVSGLAQDPAGLEDLIKTMMQNYTQMVSCLKDQIEAKNAENETLRQRLTAIESCNQVNSMEGEQSYG